MFIDLERKMSDSEREEAERELIRKHLPKLKKYMREPSWIQTYDDGYRWSMIRDVLEEEIEKEELERLRIEAIDIPFDYDPNPF